jgi:hypothetical protein
MANHHTSTPMSLVVSLPRMSITLMAMVLRPGVA